MFIWDYKIDYLVKKQKAVSIRISKINLSTYRTMIKIVYCKVLSVIC